MTARHALGAGEVVLIVDDDRAYCNAMEEILASAGFQTVKLHNGAETLAVLEAFTPDLILLDTMMPAVDGSVVLRMVRNHVRLRNIPVVTVSAKAMVGDKADAFAAGASGFLAKPFRADELLAEVGRQLSRGRLAAA